MIQTNNSRNEKNQGRPESFYTKKMNWKLLLLTFCLAFLFLGLASGAWAAEITYPVSTFNDGKARFYEYKAPDGIVIKYFILKSSDGVIRAAFDACDVCWEAGKGYTQKDDFMICKNCGRRFHSNKINEVSGGCNPAPLVRKIQDGKVVIDTQNILAGKRYFDFRGKRG
jgi:uncharacterized membrane protein